jgi:hypothetical protein
MIKRAPAILSVAMMLAAASTAAFAAEELLVNTDETKVVRPSAKPGTIVIGNPSIVDATMENGNLFIQGKAFGSTNMIILDAAGKEIGNYDVTVRISGNHNVAVFKAGGRYSYTCAPLCQEAVQVGDVHTHTGEVVTLYEQKSNLAKGISNQDTNGDGGGGAPPPPAQ